VNNWATKPKSAIRQISFQLVRRLNCTQESEDTEDHGQIERIIGCMARLPAQIVQRESDAISESLMLPMNFAFVPIDEDDHFFKVNMTS
jgi:hypothetical protein